MPRVTKSPMKNAAFDLYEMTLMMGDLYDDLERFAHRRDLLLSLEGEGREVAHFVWSADMFLQREMLATRTINLLGMTRAAGIMPREKGLIDEAIDDVASLSCREAVSLLKGLLAMRLDEGECYRRMTRAWSDDVQSKMEAAREGGHRPSDREFGVPVVFFDSA